VNDERRVIRNEILRNRYLDSVSLMRASRRLEALPGVRAAALMIGTPANKALLREAGLLAAEGEAAGVNDLVIAVRTDAESEARAAFESARQVLASQEKSAAPGHARSLSGALQALPGANLALVSVPPEFAAREARHALESGLHVLLFTNNVPVEDEVALKRLAAERGLLMMGPDCGSALIAGTPVAFANAVPRGDIGIVSASGTGLQEVSVLLARLGAGVSHAIGVGGRDLDERVGALATLAAIDALERDPATATLVLVSKPPAPAVARRVLARLKQCAKRSVVCFLGSTEPGLARDLTEAAERASGRKLPANDVPRSSRRRNGHLKGLYCGGTLCTEAEIIAGPGHDFVDLGDDRYTRGQPHPMIEPELRTPHLKQALADPGIAAVLVDVVLGYGAHEDPAGVLAAALKGALDGRANQKPVVASVTGTEQDPQSWSRQAAILRAAGVLVAPSNARAAALAATLATPASASQPEE
jgi:FdrA protein